MKRMNSVEELRKLHGKEDAQLPSFSGVLESTLSKGDLFQVDGTNVVRVPFGVRHPRKQRPERPHNWATLVLPLQPIGTPTPPPQAA